MTSISDELLTEFTELYKKHFGITLSKAVAAELGASLVGLVVLTQCNPAIGSPQLEREESHEK